MYNLLDSGNHNIDIHIESRADWRKESFKKTQGGNYFGILSYSEITASIS